MERLTKKDRYGHYYTNEKVNDRMQTNGPYPHAYDGKAIDALGAYEDAEEQGLILRLPCKVGDKVYVKLASHFESKYAEAEIVDFTHFISCGFCIVVTSKHFDKQAIPFSEFGKTVFLTKEEAEQSLKRMESE